MWGKYLVSARTRNVVLVNRNIVKFYGSVTVRPSLQKEIMAYLQFSELNSLQIKPIPSVLHDIILIINQSIYINVYVVWASDKT